VKLPNRESAVISKNKLVKYLLSETHPVGKAKARFFRKLGFNETNVGKLAKLLLRIPKENDIKNVRKFSYGTNYVIGGTIETPNGKTVKIITVWFMKTEKTKPSFVTTYPV